MDEIEVDKLVFAYAVATKDQRRAQEQVQQFSRAREEIVHKLRKLGLSQRAIAEQLGVSQARVCQMIKIVNELQERRRLAGLVEQMHASESKWKTVLDRIEADGD